MATLPSIPENLQNLPVLRKFLDELRTAMLAALESGGGGGGGGGGTGDISSDGSVAFAADESMGGHKLTNLTTPTASTDAANKNYVDGLDVNNIKKNGSVDFTGNESMGGFKLTNVGAPTLAGDATNKTYVDTQEALDLRLDGSRVMTGTLDMGTHLVSNVVDPVSAQDAATKNYVDTHDKYAAVRIVGSGLGVTDATIAAAVTALPAAGGDIYVKPGTYAIASPIDFTTKVIRIHGAGTSVAFATGPTTLVPAAGISLFMNGAEGCSVEDITVEGDNSTAQAFYEGSTEIRFTRVNVHDVGGIIKFSSSQPEVTFRDSYINVPGGPLVGNRYLWKGSAANGTLIFDNVELFIATSGATIMSGVTAGANGPEFRVTNSYVGGGGGGGSTNFWFAQVVDWNQFDIDNAQFEISGARNNIVNSNFLDCSIKFKAVWNFISNCNFSQGGTGSSFFDAQVTLTSNAGESTISGCNFYGNFASVKGISAVNIDPAAITGCLFSHHTTAGIEVTGGTPTTKVSVTGCRFVESVPVLEGAGGVTVVGGAVVGATLNDTFASAPSVTGANGTFAAGSTVGFTHEAGEPTPINTGAHSGWLEWTAPTSGTATIDLSGSTFDTVLSVFTGTVVSALTLIVADDDSGAGATSLVTFSAVGGTSYKIKVDGFGSASGSVTVTMSLVVGAAGTPTARYSGNEGFSGSSIFGPDSVVEGVRRFDVVGGTTTNGFVTQFTHVNTKGLTGNGSIKNTGTDSLTVQITAIDVYGVTDTATIPVTGGGSATWSMADAVGTALPPYVSYAVAVKSTSIGLPTTFTLHHATTGAY